MSQNIRFGDHVFAVKEHWSGFLHWDLRLQLSGQTVLSYVLYEPPHLDPSRPLKTDRVDDHKLAYLFKEWIIPEGRTGSGPTALWDRGTFRVLGPDSLPFQLERGHMRVQVTGNRLKGNFSLQWVGPREKTWAWKKEYDEYADPFRSFPKVLTPDKIQELGRKSSSLRDRDSMDLFESLQK